MEEAPPWESRATHNQLQGKKEEKTQEWLDRTSLLLTISTPLYIDSIYIITYTWLLHLTHQGYVFISKIREIILRWKCDTLNSTSLSVWARIAPTHTHKWEGWDKPGNFQVISQDGSLSCHCTVLFKCKLVWISLPPTNRHYNKCNERHKGGIFGGLFSPLPCCHICSSHLTLGPLKNCLSLSQMPSRKIGISWEGRQFLFKSK